MISDLFKLLAGLFTGFVNSLSFFYMGKQDEKLKQKETELNSINEANRIKSTIKHDNLKRVELRRIYKR